MQKTNPKRMSIKLISQSKEKTKSVFNKESLSAKKEINLKPTTTSLIDFPFIFSKKRNASYTEKQLTSARKLLISKKTDILIPTPKTSEKELMSQTYVNVASRLKRETNSITSRTKHSSYDFSTKRSNNSDALQSSNSRITTNCMSNKSIKYANKISNLKAPETTTIDSPEMLHFLQVKFFQNNKRLASKFDI
jgi:hypothetical protein